MSAALGRRWVLGGVLCASLVAGGCSIGPAPRPLASAYDFGPPPAATAAAPALREPIRVDDVAALPWLDTSAMLYRLAYRDAAQPRAYADSRWVAPPAALLSGRLRARLAAADPAGVLGPGDPAHAPLTLRVELQELSQVFETPEQSVALLELRATLLRDHRLSAQGTFVVRVPAATPDAAGGAAAVAVASDRAIAEIIGWTGAHLRP
ncbi:MAG TPA: ABC-type transport auxiliary lipoprotein family protein [Burkholderiales bacterium]|nr:ABC-type transport auxiliary lipoprotein family protein [Burkholderiales bacterium]